MKRKRITILSVAFLTLLSCTENQEEDLIYSCDRYTNSWAKRNLSSIQDLRRSEWLKLDALKQKAAYVAFTPEKRLLFWKERIDELTSMKIWNDKEIKHLKKLRNALSENPQWLNDTRSEEEIDLFISFVYEWKSIAQEELGWTNDLISVIIASGYKLLDKKGTFERPQQKTISPTLRISSETNTESDCNCSKKSDWCDSNLAPTGKECKDIECDGTAAVGCGTLFAYKCDGKCSL